MFVSGYQSSFVVFWDFRNGNIENAVELGEKYSPINCITANEFSPVIIAGHENGDLTVYDFKKNQTLKVIETGKSAITSLTLVNNGLNLLVGNTNGQIKLIELKTYTEISNVE